MAVVNSKEYMEKHGPESTEEKIMLLTQEITEYGMKKGQYEKYKEQGKSQTDLRSAFDDVMMHKKRIDWLLEQISGFVKGIESEKRIRTRAQALAEVSEDGYKIEEVTSELITQQLCEISVTSTNGGSFYLLPPEFRTEKMRELYIGQIEQQLGNGEIFLDELPEEDKTEKGCMLAMKENGNDLVDVPEKFRTKDLCILALKNSSVARSIPFEITYVELEEPHDGDLVKEDPDMDNPYFELDDTLPKELFTPQFCMEAVRLRGENIEYIPDEHMSEELCREAIIHSSPALDSPYRIKRIELSSL